MAQSPQWLYPLELPARDMTLTRRVQGNIAGTDLDHYDGLRYSFDDGIVGSVALKR